MAANWYNSLDTNSSWNPFWAFWFMPLQFFIRSCFYNIIHFISSNVTKNQMIKSPKLVFTECFGFFIGKEKRQPQKYKKCVLIFVKDKMHNDGNYTTDFTLFYKLYNKNNNCCTHFGTYFANNCKSCHAVCFCT